MWQLTLMALSQTTAIARTTSFFTSFKLVRLMGLTLILEAGNKKFGVYNILWALVFGFATINILSLVGRRFEPTRARLSPGETLAILVVVVSVFLLSWEMLYVFKVLPIRLGPH